MVVDVGFFVIRFEPARTMSRENGRAFMVFRLLFHGRGQMGLWGEGLFGDESIFESKALLPPSLVAKILGLASSNS